VFVWCIHQLSHANWRFGSSYFASRCLSFSTPKPTVHTHYGRWHKKFNNFFCLWTGFRCGWNDCLGLWSKDQIPRKMMGVYDRIFDLICCCKTYFRPEILAAGLASLRKIPGLKPSYLQIRSKTPHYLAGFGGSGHKSRWFTRQTLHILYSNLGLVPNKDFDPCTTHNGLTFESFICPSSFFQANQRLVGFPLPHAHKRVCGVRKGTSKTSDCS
jgi:hypothetical protein